MGIEKGRWNKLTFRRQSRLLSVGYYMFLWRCSRGVRVNNIGPNFLPGILDE